MFTSLVFLSLLTSIFGHVIDDPQTIRISLDEELPLSTILFTTSPTIVYRLFDSGRNHNAFVDYNSSTGNLLLARPLDREDLCAEHICSSVQCQLIVELIEWQSPYRLLKLLFTIDDINDHSPTFSSSIFHLQLLENSPVGFEVPLEPATDLDQGENSRLTYELRYLNGVGQGPFELLAKSNGGVAMKVIGDLDREERDYYPYELIASDHGQPRRSTSSKVYVHIQDVNDNPVVLSQTSLRLSLSEKTPVGTELTRINGTDKDIGLNGKIHYQISHGSPLSTWMDHFRLDPSSGSLTLVHSLDYESEEFYSLTVQVRDLGENSLARFVAIDIAVLDENDNSPQAFVTFLPPFLSHSIISLAENLPVGQMLAHVSIADQDSGLNGQLSVSIERGDDLIGMEMLDQRSFLLSVNRLIDREEHSTADDRLVLIIADHGQPARSIRLEYPIQILDVNDNPPRFDPSLSCHRHHNRSNSEPLFNVSAVDLDAGENGRISYSIVPPSDTLFTINDQGEVFSRDLLNDSTIYSFRIMAKDHGEELQLNSTRECSISTFPPNRRNDSSFVVAEDSKIFDWLLHSTSTIWISLCLLLFLLTLLTILICLRHHPRYFKENQTYHLYVTVPRQSTTLNDEEDDQRSASSSKLDEQQRLMDFHTSSPAARDSFSSASFFKEESRPVSLSISTTTTCTSCETDASISPHPSRMPSSICKWPRPTFSVVRLAEEENSDV